MFAEMVREEARNVGLEDRDITLIESYAENLIFDKSDMLRMDQVENRMNTGGNKHESFTSQRIS